jgi:hypothetical protein
VIKKFQNFPIGFLSATLDEKHEWRIPDRNGKRQYNLNSDVYLAQMDRLEAAINVKRSGIKDQIVFQHDNARPHVEGRVVQSINDKGWDLIEHPVFAHGSANRLPRQSLAEKLASQQNL